MADRNKCAVIGAGIIGICCGIFLKERGFDVTLYDPESPGSLTSKGNAGGFGFTDVMPMAAPGTILRVPGWLLDPCGPLFISPTHFPKMIPWLLRFQKMSNMNQVKRSAYALADILRSSMADTRELLDNAGLKHMFVENGAITVYKSKQQSLKDRLEWDIKRSLGVNVELLKSEGEIRELEPDLQNVGFGLYTPEWCNTNEPYELAKSLFEYYLARGGRINRAEVEKLNKGGDRVVSLGLKDGEVIDTDFVVVAAGVWSGKFCKQLGEKVLLESERGYNTTLPNSGVKLNREVVFGEEKFVISNIGGGIRIGGAAEFAGTDAPPNYRRSDKLVEIARRYLPHLDSSNGERWMGNRPTTPDSLPVIGRSLKCSNCFHAFGHGHYGLTMAATTGKLVSRLVSGDSMPFDIMPLTIDRFS